LIDMKAESSGEHLQLRDSVRKYLNSHSPLSAVRKRVDEDTGFDQVVWSSMAGQLGLHGLAIPEEYGGSGYSFAEQAIVLSELGRVLYDGPYFSTVILAATALKATQDDPAAQQWLHGIAAGDVVAAVALVDGLNPALPAGVGSISAAVVAGGFSLSGSAARVIDAASADVIFAFAATDDELSLFAVAPDSSGITVRSRPVLDTTRHLAQVQLAEAPATLIGQRGCGRAVAARVVDVALIALGAEQMGVAARALEIATEYAKVRHQFGQPIGAFQAVKHMLADAYLENEAATAAVQWAARAVAAGDSDVPLLAHMAAALCADSCSLATATAIQVVGGIATTWEHDLQMYYKRAMASAQLFGPVRAHRAELAKQILCEPSLVIGAGG
jgi:alkylation response protein AidB-like acyl-CoA dehydrogenase